MDKMLTILTINALSAYLMAAISPVLLQRLTPSIRILRAVCGSFPLLDVAQAGASPS
jgi:hypothetical protein